MYSSWIEMTLPKFKLLKPLQFQMTRNAPVLHPESYKSRSTVCYCSSFLSQLSSLYTTKETKTPPFDTTSFFLDLALFIMPVVKTIVPSGSAATAMAGMYNHHRALGLAYISVNIPMNSLQGLPLLALDRIASFSDHDTLSALVVACTQLHEPAERRLWRHLNLADHGSRSSRFEDLEDTTPVWQAAGMIDKSGWQNSPISTRVLDQLI
jgi:hypothetical protein